MVKMGEGEQFKYRGNKGEVTEVENQSSIHHDEFLWTA